jgi:hypothetical protein
MFTFDHLIIQKIVNIMYVVIECLIIVYILSIPWLFLYFHKIFK